MTKDALISYLIHKGAIKNLNVKKAFRKIDRKHFVLKEDSTLAYINEPRPIGFNQTISQPYTVALMLENLEIKSGQKILEIGTGSGYLTALLAYMVGTKGKIFSYERVPELTLLAEKNLSNYPSLKKRTTLHSSSAVRILEKNQFDRIICSASLKKIPRDWRKLLKKGGKMVYPMGHSLWIENKNSDGWVKSELPGFVFVPFVE